MFAALFRRAERVHVAVALRHTHRLVFSRGTRGSSEPTHRRRALKGGERALCLRIPKKGGISHRDLVAVFHREFELALLQRSHAKLVDLVFCQRVPVSAAAMVPTPRRRASKPHTHTRTPYARVSERITFRVREATRTARDGRTAHRGV